VAVRDVEAVMRTRAVMTIAVLFGMLASTCAARADSFEDDTELDHETGPPERGPAVRSGPPIAEVVRAAYRAAGLDRSPARGWVRRARLAGLVPWVSVRTGRNTSWDTGTPEVDHGMALEVRATWRLDRLVFDGRELQAASIEAHRRRERRRLATHVIRLYFTWRRAATRDRADEAAAELDAITDGWFSESSGFRTVR
jgi:hypothetical protein